MMQPSEDVKLFDIYTILYEPFWMQNWFLILLIAVLVWCIGAGSYFLYKKYVYKPVAVAYDVSALKALEKLSLGSFFSSQDIKAGYFEVTMIVKNYVSARYGISLISLTDHELLKKLAHMNNIRLYEVCKNVIEAAVFIKFAEQEAAEKTLREDIEAIKKIIIETQALDQQKG